VAGAQRRASRERPSGGVPDGRHMSTTRNERVGAGRQRVAEIWSRDLDSWPDPSTSRRTASRTIFGTAALLKALAARAADRRRELPSNPGQADCCRGAAQRRATQGRCRNGYDGVDGANQWATLSAAGMCAVRTQEEAASSQPLPWPDAAPTRSRSGRPARQVAGAGNYLGSIGQTSSDSAFAPCGDQLVGGGSS
jgi:hypothetical protein